MTGPVVIVGAGPVGLTAALLLARRGVECLVLERHPAPYPLPRAVHLDGEAVRILQEIGIADEFGRISRPMPGLRLVDGGLGTLAEFRRENTVGYCGHPDASMFDQPDLEALLGDAADRSPQVVIRRRAELTGVVHHGSGAHVDYEYDGRCHQVHAAAVLGCDGAKSTVRAALDVGVRDLGFTEPWLVVDVRSPKPLRMWEGVHQVCAARRAATFMHLVGDRYRWEFRILDTDDITELTSPAGLATLLAPWRLAVDELDVVRLATYTFQARVAERWRERRVFLLGDAAHQTPPFIGQGLGSGLRDAHNLAWKLVHVLRGAADDGLLDTYQFERQPHVIRLIREAILVGWALTGGGGRGAAFRRPLVRGLCRLPALDRLALTPASPRLRLGVRSRGSRLVGRLCPQPRSARAAAWFDDTLGDEFALLTLDPPPSAAARSANLAVVPIEPDGPLGRWLRGAGARAVLVRPDRVICATARRPADVDRLLSVPVRTLHQTESLCGVR
ncbi:bifunctional 3-(3-hydroxy-phenyl)propionate/3-hydroxycinnamic acid hydroxylase [Nocardia sp. CC227C]|uniref:bifunctional 3-(3-hydroxy-phenyl)propionate/3-hydroxycinnamic acid hydroxylase MhpA n=1 Tax=Nocardia sp. CC227C TaxID=3044562 RepID=UPI00278C0510|nr:bifunctional 3-(3-hydroxy-phenyl)propionate/3-hydroxycinnamic acid hydroxylase [Nocardia sp. CC227C]